MNQIGFNVSKKVGNGSMSLSRMYNFPITATLKWKTSKRDIHRQDFIVDWMLLDRNSELFELDRR